MFPEAVVLRVMREEFEKFSSSRPFGTLKTIKLVRYNQAMKPKTVQDRKEKGKPFVLYILTYYNSTKCIIVAKLGDRWRNIQITCMYISPRLPLPIKITNI